MGFSRDRATPGGWLDGQRQPVVLALLAAANLITLAVLVVTARGGIDRYGNLLGTDFLAFWTAGTMLHRGMNPYDTAAFVAAQREFFAPQQGFTVFFYPPLFLPLCWLLGFLGYFPALASWLIATALAFAAAVRGWYARLGRSGPGLLIMLAFPPAIICITHGQTAFLAAALLGLGLLLVDRRPLLGGMLLGLAAFKPQLGLLVPLVLLATGRWRALAGAGLGLIMLSLLVSLAFGPSIWAQWLATGPQASTALFGGAVGFAKFQSSYAGLRMLGVGHPLALAGQGVVSLSVAAALIERGLRLGWSLELAAATLVGALLATPFVLDYDLVLLAFPLALLAAFAAASRERAILAATFVMPMFARPVGLLLGVPIAPPILIAFFAVMVRHVGKGSAADRHVAT